MKEEAKRGGEERKKKKKMETQKMVMLGMENNEADDGKRK